MTYKLKLTTIMDNSTDTIIRFVGQWMVVIMIFLCSGAFLQVQGQHGKENVFLTNHLQEVQSFHDIEVNINVEKASLTEIIQLLEQQMGLRFMFNKDIVEKSLHRLDLDFSEAKAADVLLEIASQTGLTFSQINRIISVGVSDLRDPVLKDTAYDDQETISGTVRDSQSGELLPGVNIVVEGTTIGTSTNTDGEYELSVPGSDVVLVFSYIGYSTQRITIGDQQVIDVRLQLDLAGMDEVVVVGYGSQQRRDLTGSIRSVNLEDMPPSANTDFMQSLRGYAAGLNITGGGGVAGDVPSFEIRGPTTLSASTQPLIVLDGVVFQGSINDINVNDIERVDVLQDASAAAVYGARASNGVLLITTKTGRGDRPNLRVSSFAGFQTHSNHPVRMMNAEEYATRLVDYNWMQSLYSWYGSNPTGPQDNGGRPERPDITNPQVITGLLKSQMEVENYLAGNEVDWYDIVTRRAAIQNYDISLSGAGENYNYFISGSHTDQEGVLVNDRFARNTLRTRVQTNVTDWLRFGVNSSYSIRDHSGERATLQYARNATPLANVYNEDGSLPIEYNSEMLMRHPLRNTLVDNEDYSRNFNITGNLNVEIPVVTGLSYDFTYSHTSLGRENNTFIPSHVFEGRGTRGSATLNSNEETNWLVNNIINYNNDLTEDHSVDVTLLHTHEHRKGDFSTASATRFDNQLLGFNNLGFGEESTISNGAWDETTLAYMGRVNYGFKRRYLLTATIRRDGYSGFGPDNKYATFRSMSAAWIATDEAFMDPVSSWMDLLKLRLSVGENGNQGIGRYSSLARMNMSKYVYGGSEAVGVIPSTLGNASLGWETTTQYNIGIDYALLGHRISGSIDVYTSQTDDVLVNRSLPGATGYTSVWTNIGGVANKGIELELSTVNVESRLRWESRFIFSLNRDEITDLYGDGRDDLGNSWFIGQPISAIYDYERSGGVWTEEELYSGQIHQGFYPGQFRLRDFNGDGRISPDEDRTIVGYATPNYRFSIGNTLSYRNFNLSFLLNSIQGGNGYFIQSNRQFLEATSAFDYANRMNQPAIRQNWIPGSGVDNAPAVYNYPTYESGNYQDRSFIRLEDVTLSYTFSSDILNVVGVRGLQVYINGKNLYTWTKWEGYDPEIANFQTPMMRVITGGFRLDI
jgi:TonB-dependent starch-binding outer membrane protein SusC